MNRRDALRVLHAGLAASMLPGCSRPDNRLPNFCIILADDWSWPHAGSAGDKTVRTPWFDRIASEGILFPNAFVSSPSCAPSRASLLTGSYHWELEQAANMWGSFPRKFTCFPNVLRKHGYHIGFEGKGWSPGVIGIHGRVRNPAGPRFRNFEQFLGLRRKAQPFYYWVGSRQPHRKYAWKSGVEHGLKPDSVVVPGHLPDNEIIRHDLCDYYYEVEQFDKTVGGVYRRLEAMGELDNTIVIITSDNGMPFPRCKANLYDLGTHVPLCIRWGGISRPGRTFDDFVSLVDIAPTIYAVLGEPHPNDISGKSLLPVLYNTKKAPPHNGILLTGRERHIAAQSGHPVGYPMRSIRTHEYLFIRNFEPERWPAGTPPHFRDVDRSPTKTFFLENKDESNVGPLFQLSFGKRPAEELYDLKNDPYHLDNKANDPNYQSQKIILDGLMAEQLAATADPRMLGNGEIFDQYRYYMLKRVYQ